MSVPPVASYCCSGQANVDECKHSFESFSLACFVAPPEALQAAAMAPTRSGLLSCGQSRYGCKGVWTNLFCNVICMFKQRVAEDHKRRTRVCAHVCTCAYFLEPLARAISRPPHKKQEANASQCKGGVSMPCTNDSSPSFWYHTGYFRRRLPPQGLDYERTLELRP